MLADNAVMHLHELGIEKLISQYYKCLNCNRDYVKRKWDINTVRCEPCVVGKIKNPKCVCCSLIFWLTVNVLVQSCEDNNTVPSVYFLAIRTLPSLTLRMKINNILVRQTECAVFWASILRNMERKLIIALENEICIMSWISEH